MSSYIRYFSKTVSFNSCSEYATEAILRWIEKNKILWFKRKKVITFTNLILQPEIIDALNIVMVGCKIKQSLNNVEWTITNKTSRYSFRWFYFFIRGCKSNQFQSWVVEGLKAGLSFYLAYLYGTKKTNPFRAQVTNLNYLTEGTSYSNTSLKEYQKNHNNTSCSSIRFHSNFYKRNVDKKKHNIKIENYRSAKDLREFYNKCLRHES